MAKRKSAEAAPETPAEVPPAPVPDAPPAEATPAPGDSATFSRCAACKAAEEINPAAGSLLCRTHNMRIDAEADEIPDDCVAYAPRDGETQEPQEKERPR